MSLRKRLIPGLAGLSVCLAAGCMFPYYSSEALPDLAAEMPPDFASADTEVLAFAVLASNRRTPSMWYGEPLIAKRRDLQSMTRGLRAQSKVGMMGVDYGLKGQGVIWKDSMVETVTLMQLCLVAADGRTIAFSAPDGEKWSNVRTGVLSSGTRDAMLQALRNKPGERIERLDGPCDSFGALDWSDAQRADVEAFLVRVSP